MGIQPIGQANIVHRYTEQRVVRVKAVSATAHKDDLSVHLVETGDTFVVSLDKEESHHRMLTLSRGNDDLENGAISIDGDIGKAAIGNFGRR